MDRLEGRGGKQLDNLLAHIRESLDETLIEKEKRFQTVSSELVFQRVLERVRRSQRRGAWMMPALRRVTTTWAMLWNSRLVRMLVP
jgi:hypothetical protein